MMLRNQHKPLGSGITITESTTKEVHCFLGRMYGDDPVFRMNAGRGSGSLMEIPNYMGVPT